MEMYAAVDALAALAHETRLKIFRLLVAAGPQGVPAGQIGEELALPGATLSFHLSHLTRSGLARSRQEGRYVLYTADFQNMNALVGYLTENCCQRSSCGPGVARVLVPGKRTRTRTRP
jgi:DNA-binding transcriptional ArsR family regulator